MDDHVPPPLRNRGRNVEPHPLGGRPHFVRPLEWNLQQWMVFNGHRFVCGIDGRLPFLLNHSIFFRNLPSKLNADVENIDINVIRDGANCQVSRYEIVVGDIVRLTVGDILEGDGVLVEGFNVEMDESALTGEPILIKKGPEAPFMLSGSSIQNGQGEYLITAVGQNSEKGRIQALVG